MSKPRVVVVGGGFGGLQVAKSLRSAPVHVTLVDRSNHHTFQPLLYQVATAGLSPADIAMPIRRILRKQKNAEVLLAEVVGVDTQAKKLLLADGEVDYDYLVISTGARHSYFAHPEWETLAPGLKSLDDATTIRRRILLAFEYAERSTSEQEKRECMTFVIVGGGPTGVEMAGSIAELARRALAKDFDHIKPETASIILIEASDHILSAFDRPLGEQALKDLIELGVEVKLSTRVLSVDKDGVDTTEGRINAGTVMWAAGVQATPVASWLGVEPDRAGRVPVDEHLKVPGMSDVFVIGDAALAMASDGQPLPGIATVAMQEGRYVGHYIVVAVEGPGEAPAFAYKDPGILATIGRRKAIAQIKSFRFAGRLAWLIWLFIHIMQLVGFRNKISVLVNWAWAYITWDRGARLITGETVNRKS